MTKGEQIKQKMRETYTGVNELAAAVGVSRVSVSNWINDHNQPVYERYILAMKYMEKKKLTPAPAAKPMAGKP